MALWETTGGGAEKGGESPVSNVEEGFKASPKSCPLNLAIGESTLGRKEGEWRGRWQSNIKYLIHTRQYTGVLYMSLQWVFTKIPQKRRKRRLKDMKWALHHHPEAKQTVRFTYKPVLHSKRQPVSTMLTFSPDYCKLTTEFQIIVSQWLLLEHCCWVPFTDSGCWAKQLLHPGLAGERLTHHLPSQKAARCFHWLHSWQW